MSIDQGVYQKRPTLWSYASFPRLRRRSSVRLPSRETDDFYEKPDRHSTSGRRHPHKSMYERARIAWMAQGPRARFLRTGCVIAFVLLLLLYVSPSSNGRSIPGSSFFREGSMTGGDPAVSTTKCKTSYSKDKPTIQYALMIDAGSTGSRIHVYRFNNCGAMPELENEVFEETEKREGGSGLSSYKDDIQGAARSLDPLMRIAMDAVPDKLKSCTPIAVKATAGLRQLGTELSDKILTAVREHLRNDYPFALVNDEHGGVEVMDGKDEAVYAWITTNYLLGNLGGIEKVPTAGVFDLGGGSTQIVFEPRFKGHDEMKEGDHSYALSFGGHDYLLYQHSYLGYGLMEARKKLHRVIVQNQHYLHPASRAWVDEPIINPCLTVGSSRDVTVSMGEGHALGDMISVKMIGPEKGARELCQNFTEKVIHQNTECDVGPCAFDGIYQPDFEKTFRERDIYLVSYFYDRTYPLGMPERFNLNDLKTLATRVCQGGGSWHSFKPVPGAIEELEGRPEHCLDLNFMLALLTSGYGMELERQVNVAKKVQDNELGWCLGATLPLLDLDSGRSCNITEVFELS